MTDGRLDGVNKLRISTLIVLAGASLVVTAAANAAPAPSSTDQIAVVDQSTDQVKILNQSADWSTSSAVVWASGNLATMPGSDGGAEWGHPTDVKLRVDGGGRKVVLVSCGDGGVASIDYATRRMIWHAVIPNPDMHSNPHAIELLPNGDVAVADETTDPADASGFLWYFPYGSTTAQGPFKLPGAHGVLFHDGVLWALGWHVLQSYSFSTSAPYLTPTGRQIYGITGLGHDLSPASGDPYHGLWASDTNNVYLIPLAVWPVAVPLPAPVGGPGVKSVGNQNDNTLIETRPTATTGCHDGYTTDTVDLFGPNGGNHRTKVLPGACIYKARPVTWSYY